MLCLLIIENCDEMKDTLYLNGFKAPQLLISCIFTPYTDALPFIDDNKITIIDTSLSTTDENLIEYNLFSFGETCASVGNQLFNLNTAEFTFVFWIHYVNDGGTVDLGPDGHPNISISSNIDRIM